MAFLENEVIRKHKFKVWEKIKDTIWWKYDANNFLYPKMVVESVWYRDDCRGKLGWNNFKTANTL